MRRCAFCDCALAEASGRARGEDHHFPTSKRHGGKATIPICVTCHDLADRTQFNDLPWSVIESYVRMWNEGDRDRRLILWHFHALLMDVSDGAHRMLPADFEPLERAA